MRLSFDFICATSNGKGKGQSDITGPKAESPSTVYLSAVLRPDEVNPKRIELKRVDDRNDSHPETEQDSSRQLTPEFININVGVMRGEDMIHLETCTFVIRGQDVKGQMIYLPVRVGEVVGFIIPETSSAPVAVSASNVERSFASNAKSHKKKFIVKERGLFKRFNARQTGDSFGDDPRTFSIAPNAVLRISVDVKTMESVRTIAAFHSLSDVKSPESQEEEEGFVPSSCTTLLERPGSVENSPQNSHKSPACLYVSLLPFPQPRARP